MCFVSYLRLSKQLAGKNQYGIEAQRQSIEKYIASLTGSPSIIGEFVEYETGSRKRKCPQLKQAIRMCEDSGATLLIMKVDRLGRNLHQITSILESSIDFVAVETPNLDRFGLHILGAVAEKELEDISNRITRALKVCKQKGVRLGATRERAKKMSAKASYLRQKEADEWAISIWKEIEIVETKSRGRINDTIIADKLNRKRVFTREGKLWYSVQVGRIRKRITRLKEQNLYV